MLQSTFALASRARSAHRIALRAQAVRNVQNTSVSRSTYNPNKDGTEKQSTEDTMFAPENIENLSPIEVARMKVTYGLVREHIRAIEENQPALDPEENPLIDPRSFDVRRLPELPGEVLRALRQELPARVASNARPVPTHAVWEEGGAASNADGVQADNDSEWAAVDERTMDSRYFSRMQRQSGRVAPTVAPPAPAARARRRCVLTNERGRVQADYRAVGALKPFISEGGKILPRRKSALSAKAQRKVSTAVKSARHMALLAPDPSKGPTLEEIRKEWEAMQ